MASKEQGRSHVSGEYEVNQENSLALDLNDRLSKYN